MADNLHSTVVAWLKVILPLAALGLLSTLFLVARAVDPEGAIPYADVDIEDRLRQPRLTLPTWSGVTDDGAALTVTADEARPGSDDAPTATAARLRARLEMASGGRVDLVAATGRLDPETRTLTVEGGVEITTSGGYLIEADAMTAALDRTRLESGGKVDATGPLGTLTAGAMLMTLADNGEGHVLHFTAGVKLLYRPAN